MFSHPQRSVAQPRYKPAIARGNPITRNMVFAMSPVGGLMVDAVSDQPGARSGTNPPTPSASASGRNFLFNGGSASNTSMSFGARAATADMHLGPATWFFWCFPNGVGGLAERNDGNSVDAGWELGITSAATLNRLAFLKEHASANENYRSTNSVTLGAWGSLAVTYNGSTTAGFFLNGVSDASVVIGAGAGASGSDLSRTLNIGTIGFAGGSGLTASGFDGPIEMALFFKRILSDQEIASLHRNRYQVFTSGTFPVLAGSLPAGGSAQRTFVINA